MDSLEKKEDKKNIVNYFSDCKTIFDGINSVFPVLLTTAIVISGMLLFCYFSKINHYISLNNDVIEYMYIFIACIMFVMYLNMPSLFYLCSNIIMDNVIDENKNELSNYKSIMTITWLITAVVYIVILSILFVNNSKNGIAWSLFVFLFAFIVEYTLLVLNQPKKWLNLILPTVFHLLSLILSIVIPIYLIIVKSNDNYAFIASVIFSLITYIVLMPVFYFKIKISDYRMYMITCLFTAILSLMTLMFANRTDLLYKTPLKMMGIAFTKVDIKVNNIDYYQDISYSNGIITGQLVWRSGDQIELTVSTNYKIITNSDKKIYTNWTYYFIKISDIKSISYY
jgi:hypothetical protein